MLKCDKTVKIKQNYCRINISCDFNSFSPSSLFAWTAKSTDIFQSDWLMNVQKRTAEVVLDRF